MRFGLRDIAAFALAAVCASAAFGQGTASREKSVQLKETRSAVVLDKDWSIYKLPDFKLWPAQPKITDAQIRELHLPEPGKGWQPVKLPNDYVVGGTFSPDPNPALLASSKCASSTEECAQSAKQTKISQPGAENGRGRSAYGGHGYLPVYPAWYRRTFSISGAASGKKVWLDFGGVYRDAIVFVNGKFIAQHASGYTSFRLDITDAVVFGQKNTIAVFVDPRWFEGWFYEGGGIYRHVSLIVTNPLQVSPWGTFVEAKVSGAIQSGSPEGDRATAKLDIQTTVRNSDTRSQQFTLVSHVIDPSGTTVASVSSTEELAPGAEQTFSQAADLAGAHLWSLEHRNLYKLATAIQVAGKPVDEASTTFGVRKLGFDPNKGFFLNDKHVEIFGMCVHQDFPGVGIGAADNLWGWRLKKLQDMGSNAVRTAHGPDSEAFYDAADRLGMLVMAENRHLGDTYSVKSDDTTPYSDLSDLKDMVLQQRNHPSIIMWSMSNEEALGGEPQGVKIFAVMKDAVRKIDPSRPVTAAVVHKVNDKQSFIPLEDVVGINYHSGELAKIHATFPDLMMYGSEDLNAKSSRGTLESSSATGLCSEYGCKADSGPWSSWAPIVENSFMAGEFVWTGFDYRGEPNPFSWPAVTSQTGAMDITGAPKPVYYYWKTEWRQQPAVYIFPEWSLPGMELGKDIVVRAFSNCERVELFLNGKSQGVKDMPRDKYLDWHVTYAPGALTAVGYNHGREAARYTTETAGEPVTLQLTAEVSHPTANGQDIAPVRVSIVDAKGRVVPNADRLIRFSVSGDGTLAGVANGNPASHEPDLGDRRQTFRGLAMVLVMASDKPGSITIRAQADGLPPARLVISTVRAAQESQNVR